MIKKFLMRKQLYIYQKIILIFLGLLIPIYIMNTWMNILGSNYIKDEISNSVMSNIRFYSKHFDEEISHIKLQQMQFINNSDLQTLNFLYHTLGDFEKSQLINRVGEYLSTIGNSSDYIKNVGVYVKSINSTISTKHGVTPLPNSEYETLSKLLSIKTKESIRYFDNRLFLIEFLSNSSSIALNKANIVVFIELSTTKIESMLKQLAAYENSGAFLVSNDFTFSISTSDDKDTINHILNSYNKDDSKGFGNLFNSFKGKKYWITFSELKIQDFVIFSYIPESKVTGGLKNYNILFGVLSVLSIIIMLIFSYSVNIMIHKPMDRFVKAFKVLEADNLDVSLQHKSNDEFGYLYRGFNNMVKRIKLSIQQNFEQRIALQQSELKLLQSQINPHFLYNSFFTINRMCKIGEYDNVVNFTQSLGSYYQFITRSGADEVPFEREFRHAMDYVEIQSIRFASRIKVITDELPEKCGHLMVPRIIIQPIIENAFEHVFEKNTAHGTIRIGVGFENEVLHISVEDSGPPIDMAVLEELQRKLSNPSDSKEKTGIINVSRRIQLKFGEGSGLFVSNSEYGGLKVEVVINYGRDIKNV